MQMARLTIGLTLVGAGLVFVAQGLNLPCAPRSVMTGDTIWVVIGVLLVVAGVAVALLGRRSGPDAP